MSSINNEDLIPQKEIVITLSSNNYIKRIDLEEYREQRRGGVGVSTVKTYQDDDIQDVVVANTHADLLIFTDEAKIYRVRGHEIPSGTKQSKGTPIVNIVPTIQKNEKVVKIICVTDYEESQSLITVTERGVIKKTNLKEYELIRKNGKYALSLLEDDHLIDVRVVDQDEEIFIAASNSRINRFNVADVREMGRVARGVGGIRLSDDDKVVSVSSSKDGAYIFSLGAKGYGKLSLVESYRKTKRNAKGVITLNEDKAGKLVYAAAVHGVEDLIIMTQSGIAIRISLRDINVIGRNAKGVKIINLKGRSDQIVGVAKIYDEDATDRELTKEEYIEVTKEIDIDLANE